MLKTPKRDVKLLGVTVVQGRGQGQELAESATKAGALLLRYRL